MNQSIDISDFSQILASLKGSSAAQKTGGKATTRDEFSSILKGLANGKDVRTKAGLALANKTGNDIEENIEASGKQIIESLKKALIGKGITNFEESKIDLEALSKIEKLLLKSGADPDKVSTIISSLKAKMTNGTISLKEVFAELNTMEDSDYFKDEFFLEVSAQPYLQTLLTHMGLDAETVKNMLEDATDGEKGINLGKLVKALKSMENSKINSAALFSDDSQGAVNASDILDQIGIEIDSNDRNGKMSLGRLIAILENNASDSTATTVNSAIMKDAFSKAVDAVKVNLSSSDPAGSSRAMLARMQIKEEDKTTEDAQKSKTDKTTTLKSSKQSHENQANQPQTDKTANVVKAEIAVEKTMGSEKNDHIASKSEDSLDFAARIFDMISGKELTSSETLSGEQSQKPLPAYVANQAAKGILKAINANEKEIVLQIKPAELGRMQIRIENSEAGVKVQIIAEKSMASEVLNANKNDLTAFLAESGIKIDKVDIQLAFNFDQTMASLKDQSHQESGRRKNKKSEDGGQDGTGTQTSDDDENMTIDDRVSLTA
ncbi:flagellar hook-length control protein FliK [Desulforegula conservatrix]|uniref:flagellar hook-length control protein FliK n=1 Tax=Desulforegula conservatrix TaxID=153026 RepID=UPI000417A374|nr:flagellar hook-length control protein FliK [Desulforegula conservatrix]